MSPHRTVAGLSQVYEDRMAVHIVMELCAGGELFERIVAKGTFSEAEAARHFRTMVEMVRRVPARGGGGGGAGGRAGGRRKRRRFVYTGFWAVLGSLLDGAVEALEAGDIWGNDIRPRAAGGSMCTPTQTHKHTHTRTHTCGPSIPTPQVAHLHALGVMHRDIKPENFLLTDPTDAADLKACDFGLSDFFKPGQHFTSLIGSAYYVVGWAWRRGVACVGRYVLGGEDGGHACVCVCGGACVVWWVAGRWVCGKGGRRAGLAHLLGGGWGGWARLTPPLAPT